MDHEARVLQLGRLCGIASEYRDNFGRRRRTSLAITRALLTAMGVPWEDPGQLAQELAQRRLGACRRLLEPVQVVPPTARPGKAILHFWTPTRVLPDQVEVWGELLDEAGRRQTWEATVRVPAAPPRPDVADGYRSRLAVRLPAGLGLGYYDLSLRLQAGGREEAGRTRLIVAPPRTYLPEALAGDRRAWGLSLPLYALKSKGNWGIGDFADLKEAIAWAAHLGAAFVGVNPLHAPPPQADADPSPYSPASRLWVNFLYLNLESVPELANSPGAQALLSSPGFLSLKTRLQTSELVDYPEVYRLKRQVLGLLYQAFKERHGPPERPLTPRCREFARFLAERGESLTKFGYYNALAEFWGQSDWRRWPREYAHPDSPAVAAWARDHLEEVRLHQYGQWLAAVQLAQVCHQARVRGLPFTLYQDLALGATPGGFDTWAYPHLFARGAAMGAPPDAFNPQGQNWGLPPLIPERLRESGYQLFIDTLRANSPPGGRLRLDHVMSLFRLFWIPDGHPAGRGAYVRYPARELLALLALESVRRGTLIIGEDLGTVAPPIRRDLKKAGVFSYRVFYFERDPDRPPRAPEDYPREALAAVTTHDLPTLTGFCQGRDIEMKRNLNLYPQPQQAETDAAARQRDRRLVAETFYQRGLLPPFSLSPPETIQSCPEEFRGAVLEYLAQSRAALLEVRLEEIFGLPEQQNLPGTTTEHPNWRRKIPLTLEEMRAAPEPRRLAARLNRWRGRGGEEFGGGGQGPFL
jgi:4-alpha-glucanotransferase